jgi:hypothetical protein
MSKAEKDYIDLMNGALSPRVNSWDIFIAYIKELEKKFNFAKDIIVTYQVEEKNWEKCPMCSDEGAYMVSYEEIEQCEFCWREHNSIFNQKRIKDFFNE